MNAEADLQPVECNRQWKSFSIHWPLLFLTLPTLFFFLTFVEKPFLSLSGHERIKTQLADELSACALWCTVAINPLPLVLAWKLNWDLDLFGFIISAGNKHPCDRGDVRKTCSSSLEIIGKKSAVFFIKKNAYNLCFYCWHYLQKSSLALFALTCCIHSSAMWHIKEIWKHSICLIKTA